ncbi:riboflavin kinase/FMN adenylyltransferase [Geomicrobium halophilum]|uniref:Riboflavin biosynthesis protein n=1 Tax=Geomicrobium halophilum TaxID=549000 RepID=A0A841PNC3_9BACL|nr:riboflavin biosynthesis protein RibF [Geomicrobium halophilum]MBB6449264.1 riboflavin kinase/FMN adenylyltransferase [Geomicrobium halophilum]
MQIEYLTTGLAAVERDTRPPVVMALGYFDGVHEGHQKVIEEAKKEAGKRNVETAVLTFNPHPRTILSKDHKGKKYPELTPLLEKQKRIQSLGVDRLYVISFNQELASLPPQQFVDAYLIPLHVVHAVAGFDFSYGQYGKGNMETLPLHSRGKFDCTTVTKWKHEGEKVSSTRIRQCIEVGELEKAKTLLKRPHAVQGEIVEGDRRGREIGFPTANIELKENYVLPPAGVYCVYVKIDEAFYPAVCNFGYRPTIYEQQADPNIEAHLLSFDGDLYGKKVELQWLKMIRPEEKFASIDVLKAQIETDKNFAIRYFDYES